MSPAPLVRVAYISQELYLLVAREELCRQLDLLVAIQLCRRGGVHQLRYRGLQDGRDHGAGHGAAGFFQVTGQGMPSQSTAATLAAVRGFHEAPGGEGIEKARPSTWTCTSTPWPTGATA